MEEAPAESRVCARHDSENVVGWYWHLEEERPTIDLPEITLAVLPDECIGFEIEADEMRRLIEMRQLDIREIMPAELLFDDAGNMPNAKRYK